MKYETPILLWQIFALCFGLTRAGVSCLYRTVCRYRIGYADRFHSLKSLLLPPTKEDVNAFARVYLSVC